MFGFSGFSPNKLKPQLKMAVSRIQIASNKKSALLKQNMREIAVMLAEDNPKEEKAKIRAEALIRDDDLIEAYEILQLECELLHERIKLIEYAKTCPPDLVSVVSTLIWASRVVDITELNEIRKQFRAKYGKQFEENAMNNANGVLNERVVRKLSVDPPAAYLVQQYLEKICQEFHVDWKPKVSLTAAEMAEPMKAPVGYSVAVGTGTGLGPSSSPLLPQEEEEINLKGGSVVPPPVVTATAVTPLPPPSTISTDDFAEPDIYIPAAPGQSSASAPTGGGGGGSSSNAPPSQHDNTANSNNNNDDDDTAGIPPPAPGSSSGGGGGNANSSTTYEDLAARFDKLKK